MFNRYVYSTAQLLNAFEMRGVAVAPDAEGASGATNTDTGWNVVSG
ncbi:hypothetical protein GCM10010519_57440 [Streptomyces lactacystinicus]